VEIRPIHQVTGDSEFNEVFFDGATTDAANVVGQVDGGWAVAMGTLAFERGASTLGQNLMFVNEGEEIVEAARANGRAADPSIRQRLADTHTRLRLMRLNAMRIMSSSHETPPAAMVTKLMWASLHRDLGELAMDVLGADATLRTATLPDGSPDYTRLQRLFLFSRADTIYGGTNQIQRNIIGERALGLPKEPSA
jgi:alkylation response protein AidB-like acyl-CoA dehydrogenase